VAAAGLWVAGLTALAVVGSVPIWVPAGYVLVSLVTFAVYATDKAQAGLAGRRVPERVLHLLALAGGWPGALVGQRYFRHKTRKVRFQVVFWVIVAGHVVVVAWWCIA
jgi:uncharacterized membrane protein YsdA (DUF1294 family)